MILLAFPEESPWVQHLHPHAPPKFRHLQALVTLNNLYTFLLCLHNIISWIMRAGRFCLKVESISNWSNNEFSGMYNNNYVVLYSNFLRPTKDCQQYRCAVDYTYLKYHFDIDIPTVLRPIAIRLLTVLLKVSIGTAVWISLSLLVLVRKLR